MKTMTSTKLVLYVALTLTMAACHTFSGKSDEFVSLSASENFIPFRVTPSTAPKDGADIVTLKTIEDHKPAQFGGCDNCTFALIPGTDIKDGVIEIEVNGAPAPRAPPWAKGFIGLTFRSSADGSAAEGLYLRPVNALSEDPEQRARSVQYFSYPDYPWSRLREDSPGRYERDADIRPGDWIKMKLKLSGSTAVLYLNDNPDPVITVSDLKLGSNQSGLVGLYTEPATIAMFRNLKVSPK